MVGNCAAKIARLNDEEGACKAWPAATFNNRAPGGRWGIPELTRPSSRPTIAFELLRQRQPQRRTGPTARCGQQTLRQLRPSLGEPQGTDATQLPRTSANHHTSCRATYLHGELQHFLQGVSTGCSRPTALRHERPAAPQVTTAFSQRLMLSLPQECTAAVRSNVYLPCRGLPMVSGSSYHLSFCGGYSFSITSMEEFVNVAAFYPYHIVRSELFTIRDIALKT